MGRRKDNSRLGGLLPLGCAVLVWLIVCLAALRVLQVWHERERAVLERQANAMVHALANTLRAMGGRISRSEGLLQDVFREVADGTTMTGVALVDNSGEIMALVGMPESWLRTVRTSSSGADWHTDHVVAWDTVDVGRCAGWRVRGGWDRAAGCGPFGGGNSLGADRVRLFVSMPLTTLRARWRRDRLLITVICIGMLGIALGGAWLWALAERSAAYSTELQVAEEEKRALAEMNLVAAGLAHEIKNPLGVIRGAAQRLTACDRAPDAAGDVADTAETIVQEIDRVTSRINELLAFARTGIPSVRPVSVRDMIRDLDRLLGEDLAAAGLCLQEPDRDWIVAADPEQFRQLLFNLLHNAIRFAPDSGPVEIRVEPEGAGRCRLIVRDHGAGIPEGLDRQIFSPYFTTFPNGTGLGLAIVRRIARDHGWTVACRNDCGAAFLIRGVELVSSNDLEAEFEDGGSPRT